MSHQTFKDYLITEAKKEDPKKKKSKKKASKKKASKKSEKTERPAFNPKPLVEHMKQILIMMQKAGGADNELLTDLVLLEMVSIFKEVLVERLKEYQADPDKAKKGKAVDYSAEVESMGNQIQDTLELAFVRDMENKVTGYKPGITRFVTLVVGPVLEEIQKVGVLEFANANHLSTTNFTQTADDMFGEVMNTIINSKMLTNAEDAQVAKKVLFQWAAKARAGQRSTRKVTKQQRLKLIANAVRNVEGKVETESE